MLVLLLCIFTLDVDQWNTSPIPPKACQPASRPISFRPTAVSSYIVKVSREHIWDFFRFFSWSYRLSTLENVSRNEHLQLFGQFFSMSRVTDVQRDVALPLVSHHQTSGRLSTTRLCLAFHTI